MGIGPSPSSRKCSRGGIKRRLKCSESLSGPPQVAKESEKAIELKSARKKERGTAKEGKTRAKGAGGGRIVS